jgi:hypothetical protein
VSKSLVTSPRTPLVDLAMLKDTIAYMHDDVRRVAGLESLARALDQVMTEIDNADRSIRAVTPPAPIKASRFLPVWR